MTLFGKGDTFMLYNSTGTLSLFQAIGIIRFFINKLGYIQLEHFIWDYKGMIYGDGMKKLCGTI